MTLYRNVLNYIEGIFLSRSILQRYLVVLEFRKLDIFSSKSRELCYFFDIVLTFGLSPFCQLSYLLKERDLMYFSREPFIYMGSFPLASIGDTFKCCRDFNGDLFPFNSGRTSGLILPFSTRRSHLTMMLWSFSSQSHIPLGNLVWTHFSQ